MTWSEEWATPKLNIRPLLFLVRRTEMKKLERTCRDLPENQYCNVRIIPGTLLPYWWSLRWASDLNNPIAAAQLELRQMPEENTLNWCYCLALMVIGVDWFLNEIVQLRYCCLQEIKGRSPANQRTHFLRVKVSKVRREGVWGKWTPAVLATEYADLK